MPKKNIETEETVEETTGAANETEATEEVAAESNADASEAVVEESGKEDSSIFNSVIDTVSSAVETVSEAVVAGVSSVVNTITGSKEPVENEIHSKRAEKIGTVASDKMTNTVTVRVDRVVKHPMYRKYIKRRKKFMAHDEMGAAIGDKVRIVETRPLSARKRWRVVEIIQKAER